MKKIWVWVAMIGMSSFVGCGDGTENDESEFGDYRTSIVSDIPTGIVATVRSSAPCFVLDSGERYFPTTIDWFMSNSTGLKSTVSGVGDVAFSTTDHDANRAKIAVNAADTYYINNPDGWGTDWFKFGLSGTSQTAEWCPYVSISHILWKNTTEYLIARYKTFYSYNVLSSGIPTDNHYGDWEGATMVWKKATNATAWTFLALLTHTHGPDVPIVTTISPSHVSGKVKVFVAKTSHGTHPSNPNGGNGDWADGAGRAWDMSSGAIEYVHYDTQSCSNRNDFVEAVGAVSHNISWTQFEGAWGSTPMGNVAPPDSKLLRSMKSYREAVAKLESL